MKQALALMDDDADFLAINEHRLDKEWLGQSELYYRFAKRLADDRRSFDQAKAVLDVAVAELDNSIRSDPTKYGIEKVTESAIKAKIPTRPKYKEAFRMMLDAKHAMDVSQAAVSALDHRKRALTQLVELFLANYFADPKVTGSERVREGSEKLRRKKVRANDEAEED